VQACLKLLLDPYTLLGMMALLPLLDAVDNLVTFAQKRDVYVCDFLAALKTCQGQLYSMYEDSSTSFATDEFWSFKNLLECSHEQIHLRWVTDSLTDLNDNSAVLAFMCNNEQIYVVNEGAQVDRVRFASILATVKSECRGKSVISFFLILFFVLTVCSENISLS